MAGFKKKFSNGKPMKEMYKELTNWANLNDFSLVDTKLAEDGFTLLLKKRFKEEEKFSFAKLIGYLFLGAILAFLLVGEGGSETMLQVVLWAPPVLYFFNYIMAVVGEDVSITLDGYSNSENGTDLSIKADNDREDAVSELNQLMSKYL